MQRSLRETEVCVRRLLRQAEPHLRGQTTGKEHHPKDRLGHTGAIDQSLGGETNNTNERYAGNETQVGPDQSKSKEDFKIRSLNLDEYGSYYKNKQRIKQSNRGIKERIVKIVAKSGDRSPTSSGSRVIVCDEDSSSAMGSLVQS